MTHSTECHSEWIACYHASILFTNILVNRVRQVNLGWNWHKLTTEGMQGCGVKRKRAYQHTSAAHFSFQASSPRLYEVFKLSIVTHKTFTELNCSRLDYFLSNLGLGEEEGLMELKSLSFKPLQCHDSKKSLECRALFSGGGIQFRHRPNPNPHFYPYPLALGTKS